MLDHRYTPKATSAADDETVPTALEKADIRRVDGVNGPAHGQSFLIRKSQSGPRAADRVLDAMRLALAGPLDVRKMLAPVDRDDPRAAGQATASGSALAEPVIDGLLLSPAGEDIDEGVPCPAGMGRIRIQTPKPPA